MCPVSSQFSPANSLPTSQTQIQSLHAIYPIHYPLRSDDEPALSEVVEDDGLLSLVHSLELHSGAYGKEKWKNCGNSKCNNRNARCFVLNLYFSNKTFGSAV